MVDSPFRELDVDNDTSTSEVNNVKDIATQVNINIYVLIYIIYAHI